MKVYSLYSKLAGIIAAQFLHSRDGSISAAYSTAIYVFRKGYFLMTRPVTWATTSRMSTRPSAGLLNDFKHLFSRLLVSVAGSAVQLQQGPPQQSLRVLGGV